MDEADPVHDERDPLGGEGDPPDEGRSVDDPAPRPARTGAVPAARLSGAGPPADLVRELHRVRQLLQGVLTGVTGEAVVGMAPDGTLTIFSAGATRLLGWSGVEAVSGLNALDLLEPREIVERAAELGVPAGVEVVLASARAGQAETRTWTLLTKDARRRRVSLSVTALRDPVGAVTGFLAVGRELAPGGNVHQRLRESDERFRLAFEDAPIGMALVDARGEPGRFLRVNGALCRLMGYDEADLLRTSLRALTHPDDQAIGADELAQLASGRTGHVELEKRYVHADGHVVWARVSSSLVRGSDGAPDYVVTQTQDISDRKRTEAELSHQSLHDMLTGLPNRALLFDHVQKALARAVRDQTFVAVLFLDLDDFKVVNDSLGHGAGDLLLVELAARIHCCLRDTDTAARFGGDEFVVVAGDLTTVEESHVVAGRLEQALTQPFDLGGQWVTPSLSIGIATSTGHDDVESLLRDADAAMYRAKRRGKGRYALADSDLTVRALRQLTTEGELRRALTAGDLRLLYQPCVDLATGRVEAVEALLRWQHPSRGLLAPADFLDVAEGRDLIVPIGLWVLEEACRQGQVWRSELGAAAPRVWVNISSRQVGRHQLSEQVAVTLQETGLPAAMLGIELTERVALGAGEAVRDDLNALPGMGVALAIDDFGTGHNGFEHLRTMPVHTIKIDQSFVAGMGSDPTDSALVASIITIGRRLGLTVVAEGVETLAQQEQLTRLGCQQAQGFLLSPPVRAEAVAALVGTDLRAAAAADGGPDHPLLQPGTRFPRTSREPALPG